MNAFSKTARGTGETFGATFDEIHGSTYLERDEQGLARLGKSQVLKVCILWLHQVWFIALPPSMFD